MSRASHVNYDAVASGYDQRTQSGTYLLGVTEALQALARQVEAWNILDLGCGTGRSLQGLAEAQQPPSRCYGLDFSAGMLAQAHRLDSTYRLVQASAPYPPFAAASFEMIFCAHAFHHFPDKPQVVQAAYRLLRPGGAFAIVNFDPHEHRPEDWTIYTYFEGSYETDLKRFPALADQEAMLRYAGFQQISSPVVQLIGSKIPGEEILDSYWLRKESSSQLILLSEEVYQAGLGRVRQVVATAQAKGEKIVFRTQLRNRMVHGFKPLNG
jgi:ubiquinone/menaquinone biosynthesis C-methylase UbiE